MAGCRVGLNDEMTRTILARIYAQQERWAEADREIRQVLAVKPTVFSLWLLLGLVNVRMARSRKVLSLVLGLQAYPDTTMEQMLLRRRST